MQEKIALSIKRLDEVLSAGKAWGKQSSRDSKGPGAPFHAPIARERDPLSLRWGNRPLPRLVVCASRDRRTPTGNSVSFPTSGGGPEPEFKGRVTLDDTGRVVQRSP